ncbi:MAG TPA: chromosome segregation protein SMC [Bacteroidota bacterium]|nr:chromosome segregation protein SMC [Bacteroidota bacterium]
MYLSNLEIVGFKSFANKVGLTFDAGITAIVGPNGCGKTNVVDAIRWALGEQKASTLRSDKMEDVIFNGTKSRKPTGMAEVSLTIQNTKGILPLEYSEVVITRRVYRSGESEYYLNKTLCRLKDIKDLFMDTGMGSDAYSVIELKMVEVILSDSRDERRRLFEEAAGVTKYKHRRKDAFRKLDSVQADLNRVNDIIKEVQKAVNSLERQANKAEQYNILTKELRTLEIELYEHDYASVIGRIGPMREQLATATEEKNKLSTDLSEEEAMLDTLRSELGELEDRLAEAQIEVTEQQQRINLAQQHRVKNSERTIALNNAIDRYEHEKIELRDQEVELQSRINDVTTALADTVSKVETASLQYASKKEELDEFTVQLDAKKADVKAQQDKVIALLNELSAKRQGYERAKARVENIAGRIEYSTEENDVYAAEVKENAEIVAALLTQDREMRTRFSEADLAAHTAETKMHSLQKTIQSLKNRELELRGLCDRKRSRLDFLTHLVESHDGFSEGAKYLLQHDDWKSAMLTTVADSLSTEARYRLAIASVLGEAANYIVVSSIDEAYRGVEFLKQSGKGRTTFICLDRVPARSSNGRSASTHPGIVTWARTAVVADEMYAPLCDYLLDDVAIVHDVKSASAVLGDHPGITCVTLDGEVLTSAGVLKGGSVRAEDGGMIGKKNQISELQKELDGMQEQLTSLRDELAESEAALASIDVKALTQTAKKIEQEMTSVEMRIAQIEYEKKRIEENIQRNRTESERLKVEAAQLQNELASMQPEIEQLEMDKSAAEQASGASVSELETMEVLWGQYAEVANKAQMELLQLENDEKNFARELEYTHATIKNIHTTLAQRDIDVVTANKDIDRLAIELSENESELTRLNADLKKIAERRKVVENEYTTKRNQMHTIELKIKDERRAHESSMGLAHELEMKIAELALTAQNLIMRAKDELELALELKEYPEDDPFDLEASREQVRLHKEKLRSLGAVNFAAFDEFQKEKERHDFIVSQRDDLIEAEKTLLSTIEEINATAQREFLSTFGKIRENFITTFKGLFEEGDECDLKLEENVDPLEARVEIIAKPRGKRPTSIDLLSGGEKTLTAIALLFAIYLVKPSPFCILDEVDAPLDDSNIDRFSRIIRKFADNTQFIVVTHNKRTMESANAMYGVTMEEQGISKLVSVRFNENKVAKN